MSPTTQNPTTETPLRHRTHSAEDPLPSKAPFDYSPQSMQRVNLPPSEEGDSQFQQLSGSGGASAGGNQKLHVNCDCERTKSGSHAGHCMSRLHRRDEFVNEPVGSIKAPEGHSFFGEVLGEQRPKPVSEEGE